MRDWFHPPFFQVSDQVTFVIPDARPRPLKRHSRAPPTVLFEERDTDAEKFRRFACGQELARAVVHLQGTSR